MYTTRAWIITSWNEFKFNFCSVTFALKDAHALKSSIITQINMSDTFDTWLHKNLKIQVTATNSVKLLRKFKYEITNGMADTSVWTKLKATLISTILDLPTPNHKRLDELGRTCKLLSSNQRDNSTRADCWSVEWMSANLIRLVISNALVWFVLTFLTSLDTSNKDY